MLKAILDGRASQLADLAKVNLARQFVSPAVCFETGHRFDCSARRRRFQRSRSSSRE